MVRTVWFLFATCGSYARLVLGSQPAACSGFDCVAPRAEISVDVLLQGKPSKAAGPLPSVTSLHADAKASMDEFSTQAKQLVALVHKEYSASKDQLYAMKTACVAELNRSVKATTQLKDEADGVQTLFAKENATCTQLAGYLQQRAAQYEQVRGHLLRLGDKIELAHEFVANTLRLSEDGDTKELLTNVRQQHERVLLTFSAFSALERSGVDFFDARKEASLIQGDFEFDFSDACDNITEPVFVGNIMDLEEALANLRNETARAKELLGQECMAKKQSMSSLHDVASAELEREDELLAGMKHRHSVLSAAMEFMKSAYNKLSIRNDAIMTFFNASLDQLEELAMTLAPTPAPDAETTLAPTATAEPDVTTPEPLETTPEPMTTGEPAEPDDTRGCLEGLPNVGNRTLLQNQRCNNEWDRQCCPGLFCNEGETPSAEIARGRCEPRDVTANFSTADCDQVQGSTDIHWRAVAGPKFRIFTGGRWRWRTFNCSGVENTNMTMLTSDLVVLEGTGVSNIQSNTGDGCIAPDHYSFSISYNQRSMAGWAGLEGSIAVALTRYDNEACFVGHWKRDDYHYVMHIAASKILKLSAEKRK